MKVVLDSGAVTFLSGRSERASVALKRLGKDAPFLVPTMVMIECLEGRPTDAGTNRFFKAWCRIVPAVPERTARRAAQIRRQASGAGSAVDALVVALGEHGSVITGDRKDIDALSAHANDVTVIAI